MEEGVGIQDSEKQAIHDIDYIAVSKNNELLGMSRFEICKFF
jgi:hypothetical protein